jgi:hypothetical protein
MDQHSRRDRMDSEEGSRSVSVSLGLRAKKSLALKHGGKLMRLAVRNPRDPSDAPPFKGHTDGRGKLFQSFGASSAKSFT